MRILTSYFQSMGRKKSLRNTVEERGAYNRDRFVGVAVSLLGARARSIALEAAMNDGSLWLGAHYSQGLLSRQQGRRH